MTIDLGFAWLSLPDGGDIGIVDVPGHRDFIENMLAGIGGIDAVIFVIAADEGIMPQTREHLAILDLLQISAGVIALTKIDLIDDPDWLDLIEEDIHTAMSGTALENAPIVRVSSRSRQGMPDLLQALSTCLSERPARLDLNRPRLPVDRVFTMPGFGTVVTGTLSDGGLRVGEEIQVLPGGQRGRVRGLQTHKRKEEFAVPGSRTAVNISGVNVDQVKRGDVIAHPGKYQPTRRIDAQFRLLKDVSQPLEHNTEVKCFLGAAEVVARLRLLGSEQLTPGQSGWLQLELSEPLVAVRGDRYILRRPSPGETLGGGIVIDPQPGKRHKRFSAETLGRLESLAKGTPSEVLLQAMFSLGIAPLADVLARANLDAQTARQAYQELYGSGQILALEAAGVQTDEIPSHPTTLITSQGTWDQLARRTAQEIETYHRTYPLRRGLPREELKSRLKLSPRIFNAAMHRLSAQGILEENGPLVCAPGYTIQFSPAHKRLVDALMARFAASPYAPPTAKDCISEVGEDLYSAMIDLELLVPIPPDVVFRKADYLNIVDEIRKMLSKQGTVSAAEVRDHFNTSRRYVLAILEHLDAQGITVREGDVRRLK
jgi:selenocysteine-specific elongation factor